MISIFLKFDICKVEIAKSMHRYTIQNKVKNNATISNLKLAIHVHNYNIIDNPRKIIVFNYASELKLEKNLLDLLKQRIGKMYQMTLRHVLFLFLREN